MNPRSRVTRRPAGRSASRWPTHVAPRIVVAGCGLIGGSVAAAARRCWPRARIIGVDRRGALRAAADLGLIDDGHLPGNLAAAIAATVDLVVLATPIDTVLAGISRVAGAAAQLPVSERPLVIDVASVKTPIVEQAQRTRCPRFVGGHPMAGREHRGAKSAEAGLFDDAVFALCRPATTTRADVRRAAGFARSLGAVPKVIDAALHDRCVAMVSHMPHVAALTMMEAGDAMARRLPEQARRAGLPWRLAAGSWRDATRVAASDPALWRSIVGHNREAIGDALDLWIAALRRVRRDLRRAGTDPLAGPDGGPSAAQLAALRRKIARFLPRVRPPPCAGPGG